MAEYAVGDIQGCMDALSCVLKKVKFDPSRDKLWLAGDLVNRGPQSLEVLRYVKSLGDSAITVLGNHDLHLLAVAYCGDQPKRKDTIQEILDAPDREELLTWLRKQPLLHYDKRRDLVMVHAGIPSLWSIKQAVKRADEMHQVLSGKDFKRFLQNMYGNSPTRWQKGLDGYDRLRVITNYCTRMRFIDEEGNLDLINKADPESAPDGFAPWFSYARADSTKIIFGHWAALLGKTGSDQFIGLDTGCIWGGDLTLMDIDTGERVTCQCQQGQVVESA